MKVKQAEKGHGTIMWTEKTNGEWYSLKRSSWKQNLLHYYIHIRLILKCIIKLNHILVACKGLQNLDLSLHILNSNRKNHLPSNPSFFWNFIKNIFQKIREDKSSAELKIMKVILSKSFQLQSSHLNVFYCFSINQQW